MHSNDKEIPYLPYINRYDLNDFQWKKNNEGNSPLKNFFYSIVVNYSHYSYNIYDLRDEWDEEVTKNKLESPKDTLEDQKIKDKVRNMLFERLDSHNQNELGNILNKIENQDLKIQLIQNLKHSINSTLREHTIPDFDKCWTTGIFHKNDGYQTPIVLNPFRRDGYYIDTQSESELEKDRFLTIILALNNQENVFTKVIDNKYVDSISIKIKGYNKLDQYKEECKGLGINFEKNIYIPLIRRWKELYPIQEQNNDSPYQKQALDYLVYKTLRVGFQYKNFSWHSFSINQDAGVLLNMIESFRDDNSHMTLKLKQTLSFLMNNHIEESENITVADLSEKVYTQVQTIKQFLEEYKEKKKKDNPHGYTQPRYVFNEIDCLPPPIFDTELYLKTGINDLEKPYPFNTLSSGEKQMIYTVSSILYHINNINSVHQGSKYSHYVKYEHINIILEEVELYYHPEMQRKLIKYLIDQIKALNTYYIKSLQIMLVTHSPFVLSDIPINNVLFLENGSPSHKMGEKHNTFSANIYDLFHESFFLEAPMGEFASDVIKRLFEDLKVVLDKNKKDTNKKVTIENMSIYESIINQIGDEFVHFELKRQLYDKIYNTAEAKIKLLEEQIKKLKKGVQNA